MCSYDLQHTDSSNPAQSDVTKHQHGTPLQQHGDTPQSRQQKSDTSQLHPTTPAKTTKSNDSSSLSVTAPLQQNNVCLLKTAIGTVVHGSRSAEAKILLDEGSQRSFITQDLAKSLALQPHTQEKINISSFGTTCPTSRTLDTAIINLRTRSGETLRLSVLIVLFIATPLQNTCCINVTSLPHLHNLQLAHPLTADREFKISSW